MDRQTDQTGKRIGRHDGQKGQTRQTDIHIDRQTDITDSKTKRQADRQSERRSTHQEELGEFPVGQVPAVPAAKVQAHELTVPIEGDVLVDGGLTEDLLHILCKRNTKHTTPLDTCFILNVV
jgi:hypothetical protein